MKKKQHPDLLRKEALNLFTPMKINNNYSQANGFIVIVNQMKSQVIYL